jgi:hypothetical protein
VLSDEAKHEALLWSASITRRVLAAQGRTEVSGTEFHELRERLFAPRVDDAGKATPIGAPALVGLQRGMLARQIITPDLDSTAKIRARVYTMVRLGWLPGTRISRFKLDALVAAVKRQEAPVRRKSGGLGPEASPDQRSLDALLRVYDRKRKQIESDAALLAVLEARVRAEGVEIDWTSSPPQFKNNER